ncbi:hypothetical protein P691DRAFT_801934 [Macrolepiota fuliginosa MF-IS2]|uniref:Restriction endonuclease type IV Mrr domain-containing protein n=1 Tax=Macrolepiota fuliginosa MF-IS2 TaxID=1400762 RepID=A0A9P6C3Q0_9AGAR|nr:hypothetical protein P691DRAFT_801934 [Macrolepiota fuliginosa MF-IS2]
MLARCSLLNTLASAAKNSRHAKRYTTNVLPAPLSTVHRGINFEGRCIALLERHLSMSLKRVGGKGDGGVDMFGWWWIPDASKDASISGRRRRIRVIAQCKAEKKKIGPKYVRELEGVLHRYHMSDPSKGHSDLEYLGSHDTFSTTLHAAQNKEIPFLGLFISESAFTKATVLHAQSSHIPLLLLHLPPENKPTSSSEDTLGTAIWNLALAGDQGLLGGKMEIRWERCINGPNRPGLWWRDARLLNWVPSEV